MLPAGRGTIYDRLGNPLAIGEQATDVDRRPDADLRPAARGAIAAKVLGLKFRPVYRQLSDRSLGFVYVERKASPKLAAKLEKRHLVGFTFAVRRTARVPAGNSRRAGARVSRASTTPASSGLEFELNR